MTDIINDSSPKVSKETLEYAIRFSEFCMIKFAQVQYEDSTYPEVNASDVIKIQKILQPYKDKLK